MNKASNLLIEERAIQRINNNNNNNNDSNFILDVSGFTSTHNDTSMLNTTTISKISNQTGITQITNFESKVRTVNLSLMLDYVKLSNIIIIID